MSVAAHPFGNYCQFDMRSVLQLCQFDANSCSRPNDHDPLIVVGSGLAGLLVAVCAAEHVPVVIVTKTTVGDGSSSYAQGGIAAAMGINDSVVRHVADTIDAGSGLCDETIVREIVHAGPDAVALLSSIGVAFDRHDDGLALGREGAHSVNRIVHAGGDATGAQIISAVRRAARNHPNIEIRDFTHLRDLVLRDGCVCGITLEDRHGVCDTLHGRAVVLATGGVGQLFARTTNPLTATGDGIAAAARAGAVLADVEMMQFHPTALAIGASPLPLVSEAVRGEGGYLRDADGRRFLLDEDPRGELGPRDVVARAVARTARATGADVTLDLRHIDRARVYERFPTVARACTEAGLDLASDLIPITPAAHYFLGGVLADTVGRTSLYGLYAIGECAATGLHGANRLASNSLLEAAVMAQRCAEHIAAPIGAWMTCDPVPSRPMLRESHTTPLPDIPEVLWGSLGLERNEGQMGESAAQLAACAPPESIAQRDQLLLAQMMIRAARLRTESRGAHYRSDFPLPIPAQQHRIAWLGSEPYSVPWTAAAAGAPQFTREAV